MIRGWADAPSTTAPSTAVEKALSATMMLTSGGMTGRLDRLQQAALITRSPDPADRRGLVITMTDAGRTLVDEAVGAGLAAQREVLDRLPARVRTQLNALLRDLLAAAESR